MKPVSLLILLIISGLQGPDKRAKHFNLDEGLALQGYDVVAYFSNKATEGKKNYAYTFQSVTYRFINQKNLDVFKANPAKYEPRYGGWCAYAMGQSGEKVEIDAETFKILDGKLYLFYNSWGNNTLTKWNRDEKNLKTRADANWTKFLNK